MKILSNIVGIWALAGLIIVVAGCSNLVSGAEYFCLGVRKTYTLKMRMPSGTFVEGTVIGRWDGMEHIDGKTYYKSVRTIEGIPGIGLEPDVSYLRLTREGIYSRKSLDPASPEYFTFPFPAEIGRKWSYDDGVFNWEYEIVSVEDFDIAERTYLRCLKVIATGVSSLLK